MGTLPKIESIRAVSVLKGVRLREPKMPRQPGLITLGVIGTGRIVRTPKLVALGQPSPVHRLRSFRTGSVTQVVRLP